MNNAIGKPYRSDNPSSLITEWGMLLLSTIATNGTLCTVYDTVPKVGSTFPINLHVFIVPPLTEINLLSLARTESIGLFA